MLNNDFFFFFFLQSSARFAQFFPPKAGAFSQVILILILILIFIISRVNPYPVPLTLVYVAKITYFAVIIRLQGDGLCDRRKRPCKKVTVFGIHFLNSTNLTCHVKEFKVSNLI